jgi:hypothetical protein
LSPGIAYAQQSWPDLYEFKEPPPGTYTITAWQEKLGSQTEKVTASAGEAKTLVFAFKH